MADAPNFGSLVTDAPALEAPGWDTPFRFAIFGDFTGRAARGAIESPEEIAGRKGLKIDRENFDEVVAGLDVTIPIKLKGGNVELKFESIEDFHPDRIVARVERFEDSNNAKEKSTLLSDILHNANFRSLEAAWLGIDWLLKKAWKSDNGVEVVLYDLAEEEFAACLNADDDLSQSVLYAWAVEKAQKGYNAQPWGALVGLYSFPMNAESSQLLGRMGRIARHASAPFLATTSEKVWDKAFKPSAANAAAWQKLRELPESAMLGLATPGFLLRPPFGSGTKKIESFAYEEYKTNKDQTHYVWGNPALAAAALLAKSFTKKNWNFKPGSDLDLADMPMHVARDEDNEEVLMTLGTWLLQPAADKLIKQGLMPLVGVKGRNEIRLSRFLPLAAPPANAPSADLVGSWGQKALKGIPRTPTKAKIRDVAAGVAPMDGYGGAVFEATPESAGEEAAASADGTVTTPAAKKPAKKKAASSKAFDMNNLDDLVSRIDVYEEEQKKIREEAEAAANASSDSGSSDFGSSDFGSSDMPSDTPSEMPSDTPADASAEMDPELAALLAGSSDTPSEPSADASTELDPELAALLAGTGDTPSEPSADSPPADAPAADTEMDPELAAMLKQMEEGK
jgi:type VI secretion system ImpB/VipA family protein